jgi:hypothetical protein
MSIIGTIQNIQSNIIGYESLVEYGFCRKQVSGLVNTAGDLELGTVVFSTDGTNYAPLTDAQEATPTATSVGVIIGFGQQGEAIAPEGVTATEKGLLIVQGVAILRKQYLKGATGNTLTQDEIAAYLESQTTLINVDDSFVEFTGTYSNY